MLAYEVCLIARADPIKLIMNHSILIGRINKWALIQTELDFICVLRKPIKGQALADFIATRLVYDDFPLITELPGGEMFTSEDIEPHWKMYSMELLASTHYPKEVQSEGELGHVSFSVLLKMAYCAIHMPY